MLQISQFSRASDALEFHYSLAFLMQPILFPNSWISEIAGQWSSVEFPKDHEVYYTLI